MSADVEQSAWSELPIVCPHCGNHGEADGSWQANAWVPFKLIEEVVRSWEFAAVVDGGVMRLMPIRRAIRRMGRAGRIYGSSACSVSGRFRFQETRRSSSNESPCAPALASTF
ncbi:MAG TPA: hypothetical protein VF911_00585 [Thermoanaerobaculia bacterium]